MTLRTGYSSTRNLVRHVCARLIVLAVCICFGTCEALATAFTVNSTSDIHDANPGDGVCETAAGNHICTLRAAIEEANKLSGVDTIALQANATYLLSLTSTVDSQTSDLIVTDSVTITGAGPNSTVIDGNGASTHQRVFLLFRCIGNVVNQQNQSCTNGDVSVSMSGIRIKNGFSANLAGGIFNLGILTLDNVAVTDNTANGLNDWGGGIYNAGPLTMT